MVAEEHIYRVRDAIRDLQALDPDLPLVLSSDGEGNNIRIVSSIHTQLVASLEYEYMETVHEDDIDEYENPIDVAEVW